MTKKHYETFIDLIEREDKDNAMLYILDLLEKGADIIEVYESLLIPSLSDFVCLLEDEEICIWKEHTRTSIIRTILESTYPYVIKAKATPVNKKVITLCPQEEYHEIGAILATHYFSMAGFDASYIGANTPSEDIISAIRVLKPDYIALSVTNYYNIVVTKRLTAKIRKLYPDVSIVLGGQAFLNKNALEQVNYDFFLTSYKDIEAFKKEVIR